MPEAKLESKPKRSPKKKRYFIDADAKTYACGETGHNHDVINGSIDCSECAEANGLPIVDEEQVNDSSRVHDAVQSDVVSDDPGVSGRPDGD